MNVRPVCLALLACALLHGGALAQDFVDSMREYAAESDAAGPCEVIPESEWNSVPDTYGVPGCSNSSDPENLWQSIGKSSLVCLSMPERVRLRESLTSSSLPLPFGFLSSRRRQVRRH